MAQKQKRGVSVPEKQNGTPRENPPHFCLTKKGGNSLGKKNKKKKASPLLTAHPQNEAGLR